SAEALRRYVEGGGTLLAIGETATHTELGDRRDGGALDDLFAITWRDDRLASVECDLADALIGDLDVSTGRTAAGLPPTYRLPGLARLVRTESAEVLAVGRYTPPQAKAYTRQGIKRPDPVPCIEGAAIVRRSVGKGQALLV